MNRAVGSNTVNKASTRGKGRPKKADEEVGRQLAIRLTDGDREALRSMAAKNDLSLSAYIVSVLRRHLEGGR